jgi:ribosomal protein S18 acetylase RimI-like enzyme
MPVKIRAMLAHDRPAVIKILEATTAFVPADVQVAIELIDCYLADSINSGYHFWVAESDGQTVGYICYGPTPLTEGTWDIYWMATAPQLKGQGIGGALMKLAEDNIREAGGRMTIIETSSNPHYLEARKFHLAHGYIIVSSIPDFYSPGDNKITFRKLL